MKIELEQKNASQVASQVASTDDRGETEAMIKELNTKIVTLKADLKQTLEHKRKLEAYTEQKIKNQVDYYDNELEQLRE